MHACRITWSHDHLRLRPTFGTLSGFWLLLAVPASGLLLGTFYWLRHDASSDKEVPAFAIPLFLGLVGAAVVSLIAAVGSAPFPIVLDRDRGVRLRGRSIPVSEMTSVRVEDDENHEFHLWLHLRGGDRVEFHRPLWPAEPDRSRVLEIGDQLASFLQLPLIDCSSPRPLLALGDLPTACRQQP